MFKISAIGNAVAVSETGGSGNNFKKWKIKELQFVCFFVPKLFATIDAQYICPYILKLNTVAVLCMIQYGNPEQCIYGNGCYFDLPVKRLMFSRCAILICQICHINQVLDASTRSTANLSYKTVHDTIYIFFFSEVSF